MDYNFKSEYHDAVFQVSLYNSSGKKVLVWKNDYTLKAVQTVNRRYGANYSSFPSGLYHEGDSNCAKREEGLRDQSNRHLKF